MVFWGESWVKEKLEQQILDAIGEKSFIKLKAAFRCKLSKNIAEKELVEIVFSTLGATKIENLAAAARNIQRSNLVSGGGKILSFPFTESFSSTLQKVLLALIHHGAEELPRLKREQEEEERMQRERQQQEEELARLREGLARLKEKKLQGQRALLAADAERNGYPPLDENLLHDPLRGHWDLWPHDAAPDDGKQVRPVEDGLMARDPAGDIQRGVPVCIDFGTSSTVVALRENGRKRLLRVGIQDWQAPARATDFENPTALEFVDAAAFSAQWQQGGHWRPRVSWKDLKCSHQARNDISRVATSATLFSIISDLKTWARNAGAARPLEMRDQKGAELLLAAPAGDGPEGAAPTLDPLAIYAFHLGLAINNQYRGNGRIYHEYYLSFPVAFDTATRKRIRDSFALGLERSLPETLGRQAAWRGAAPFSVREGAEEPVAYAAAALAESGLEPDDRGVPFGVFDFGGGTTDFAFGLYRWATDEEERAQGWERVIHLLDVTGDGRLGGEALLRELAFAVIADNAEDILKKNIPFVLPDAAASIPAGLERIFADSLIARANATHLAEALRPLWEEGPDAFDSENEGLIHVRVQGQDGNEQDLELRVDKDRLLALLHDRILEGVAAFFAAFRQAFKRHEVRPGGKLHIFPAGNACRSPLVRACFNEHMEALAREENFKAEHFLLHAIRLPDDASPEALTLKTGVALGLLDTVPGESVGICRVEELDSPDTGFRHAFGVFRRGRLAPVLTRFSGPGEWTPLGQVRADLRLIVGWSTSPLALEGEVKRGDADCRELSLVWSAADAGRAIFARTTGQDAVELALGNADGTVDETTLRSIVLGDE